MRGWSHKPAASRFLQVFVALLFTCAIVPRICSADTFTHRQTGEILHGYKTSEGEGGQTFVQTQEKGRVKLNLAQWTVVADRHGRNNKVYVIQLSGPIAYEIETEAFERAVARIADKGPLFLLLEIDTPGGRVDYAHRICAAITGADNLRTVAYIKGGETGGALSAGAAVSLAADTIYMAQDTVIGAATMITGEGKTIKEAYGEDVGEKFDSAWRARLASLAERNGRAGILARAMVDRDIEVVEVAQGPVHLFIDPVNRKPGQDLIKVWSKKGSLLTLTATEAVSCGFAEAVAESRDEVLRKEAAVGAEIVVNDDIQEAAEELRRARGQLLRIRKSVDLKIRKSEAGMSAPKALRMLRDAKGEFRQLINLARKYPDLGLDIIVLENELNSIEAAYRDLRSEVGRSRLRRR